MLILKLIAGPVIGAVIGYCTNYIAVKMLFRPHKPVMIGKHRLPFTPGLIPKRKDQLATAIGSAIGDVLLTKNDLLQALPQEAIKDSLTDTLWGEFLKTQENTDSVQAAAGRFLSEETYVAVRKSLEDILTEKILRGLTDLDIGGIVVEEGTRAIQEKVHGSMLSMMVNDQMIESLVEPVGEKIGEYIEENGEGKIRPVVGSELAKLEEQTVGHMVKKLPVERRHLRELVDRVYDAFIQSTLEDLMDKLDISGIVEEKIREMDVPKLEKLILSVMKKELNAIVNLGALIGLVIGLLNLAISLM